MVIGQRQGHSKRERFLILRLNKYVSRYLDCGLILDAVGSISSEGNHMVGLSGNALK